MNYEVRDDQDNTRATSNSLRAAKLICDRLTDETRRKINHTVVRVETIYATQTIDELLSEAAS